MGDIKKLTVEEAVSVRLERLRSTFKLDADVIITLKGKDFILEFNNYAIKEILKNTAINLMSDGLSSDVAGDFQLFGQVVYWGLKTHHPELEMEELDKLLTHRHYPAILASVREALNLFMPDLSDLMPALKGESQPEESDPT